MGHHRDPRQQPALRRLGAWGGSLVRLLRIHPGAWRRPSQAGLATPMATAVFDEARRRNAGASRRRSV